MTLFTKNPLERLMMDQRPYPGKEESAYPRPGGAFLLRLFPLRHRLRPSLLP